MGGGWLVTLNVNGYFNVDLSFMKFHNFSVFRTKENEMEWAVRKCGLEDEAFSDACVRLRGLPFGCSKEEIAQFFTGNVICKVSFREFACKVFACWPLFVVSACYF